MAQLAFNDWMETTATVIGCRLSWNLASAGEEIANRTFVSRYIIKFCYEVNGEIFTGRFKSTQPYDEGHTFEISYDPMHPEKNTGADRPLGWLGILLAIACGILISWWTSR